MGPEVSGSTGFFDLRRGYAERSCIAAKFFYNPTGPDNLFLSGPVGFYVVFSPKTMNNIHILLRKGLEYVLSHIHAGDHPPRPILPIYSLHGPTQVRRYKTWRPPSGLPRWEADRRAAEAYRRFKAQCRGSEEDGDILRFADLYQFYFEEYAPARLKPSTIYNYRRMGDTCILPVFGRRPVSQITTAELSAFFMGHPAKAGATCVKLKVIMSSILSFAVQQGYLTDNPCHRALCRPPESKTATVLSLEDASRLNHVLRANFCTENVILHTMLHTGIRTGECLGLQWKDVDFENQILHIRNTLSSCGSGPYLSSPKTKSSQRSIRFDACVFEQLRKQQVFQEQQKAAAGSWTYPSMVFTNNTGGYYSRCHLRLYMLQLFKENDLPTCTLHSLRHTFATLMINAGVHIKKAVSSVLGHSSISVTGDVYSHTLAEYEAKAAAAVSLKLG